MQGLDPAEMLKEADETSGKLASKSKTMSTKASGKKFKVHQITTLGVGSVIGCEDVLTARSETHVTSLLCLSHKGALYKIEKEFFFSKLGQIHAFMRKLEKDCLENVKDSVRKIAVAKQNEEKAEIADIGSSSTVTVSTAISVPSQPIGGDKQKSKMPTGLNLRKEAQKIDLKQFDYTNADHVGPLVQVLRPPGIGIGDQNESSSKNRENSPRVLLAFGSRDVDMACKFLAISFLFLLILP